MKFKPVPEPPASLAGVADAQRAVPLVAGSEDDCCARLGDRLDLPREDARTWLTFLRALELAEETDSGYARTRRDVDRDALATSFRERVFGVSDLLAVLDAADRPLSPDEAFDRFADSVPTWERHKNPGSWETVWRERVADLLGWAALLGLAERTPDGYRAPTE